ncbi:MAG: reprolysin-like metallopeptidase, partial [Cyclobacteriaceae bacterium]
SGKSLSKPGSTLKISLDGQGIQTMVFRPGDVNEYIEPYSADKKVYAVFRKERPRGQSPWVCSTQDKALVNEMDKQVNGLNNNARSGDNLKTLRLAQSVTAEYSNYFGATSSAQVNLVLAAVNATLTRSNGVYEKDLALHLNLIPSSTSVFYYTPSSDPYGSISSWGTQLQSTLNSVIGAANYDIGHLFGATGGGGNAGCIGCICEDAKKGSAYTSPADAIPQGDNFDIDYVVHEVGHQLGANHTFSHSLEGTGVNKEPGSGITIMGYAGITGQDLAPHSIDIFHQTSIAQIQSNLNGRTCPVTIALDGNATPTVSAGADYTIPISTPFALTGTAADADLNDVLTYCWEQNDNATTTGVASATKTSGPNWISFKGTTSPVRYFPKLSTILSGSNVSGPLAGGDAGANTEALSSVSRTLNFRLTVRDNAIYTTSTPYSIGQTQFDDMVVTVTNTSGPFGVTAPNTNVSWAGNTLQTINWSVNNTTAAPVSCGNVKISLSIDGGNTFTTLIESTPNDGSQAVAIPNTPSTTARIKVEAVGNIFFDISNANFTITAGSSCGIPATLTASSITNTSATISWAAVSGANSYDVDYKAAATSTWLNVATATTSTSALLSGLTEGTVYDYRVRVNCTAGTGSYAQAQFTTTAPCNPPGSLASSNITSSSATVSWAAVVGGTSYTVEHKLTSGTTWTILAPVTGTSTNITGLAASTSYTWRVKSNCGSTVVSSYSTEGTFTTASGPVSCASALDNTTNNTLPGAATIPFTTDIKGLISASGDIDNFKFNITTAGTVTLSLSTLPTNYDLYLLNSTGGTISSGRRSGTNNESFTSSLTAPGTYYAQVRGAKSNNFNSTTCYTLRVTPVTAAREISVEEGTTETLAETEKNIVVYPNPAGDLINLSAPWLTGPTDVLLLSTQGRQMMRSTISPESSQIDISALPAGLYVIQLRDDSGESHRTKLIKY